MKKAVLLTLVLGAIGLIACKRKPDDIKPEFDKEALLINVADNIIIPRIQAFDSKLASLEASFNSFSSNPNQAGIDDVRAKWTDAYIQWQYVKTFDFGPIMSYGFKASTGTFPSDTALINSNITNGGYDLNTVANIDAIGLSALDYLLHQPSALVNFASNASYRTYASEVIAKMSYEAGLVLSEWNSYRSTFVSSTGTSSTSAFSLLVNAFNKDYEIAKNAKVGIPIGKQSLGIQMPEYIEAKFSGISFELLDHSVNGLHELYRGISTTGSNGMGFDDYLLHLERSTLNSTIISNFNGITNKIHSFNNTFEEEMQLNPTGLDELYNLLQGQVVKLKTDMTSAFGVLITYQDNDGD